MLATYGTQLATAMACVRMLMTDTPAPIATSAEISGRSAASTERRNAMNKTTSASTIPRIRLVDSPPGVVASTAAPPSWTFSSELSADWAVETSVVTAEVGTVLACSSRFTVARPIVPSLLIWPPGA